MHVEFITLPMGDLTPVIVRALNYSEVIICTCFSQTGVSSVLSNNQIIPFEAQGIIRETIFDMVEMDSVADFDDSEEKVFTGFLGWVISTAYDTIVPLKRTHPDLSILYLEFRESFKDFIFVPRKEMRGIEDILQKKINDFTGMFITRHPFKITFFNSCEMARELNTSHSSRFLEECLVTTVLPEKTSQNNYEVIEGDHAELLAFMFWLQEYKRDFKKQ